MPASLAPGASHPHSLRLSPAMRRMMLGPVLAALLVGVAAIVVGPWQMAHRDVMLLCALIGWVCIALEYSVPWDRTSYALYVPVLILGLADIGLAMWASGGWGSPFTPFLILPVTYAVMCTDLRHALPVAASAGLVTASPGLYLGNTRSFAMLALAAVPAYALLVIMIDVIVKHLRSSDRKMALEIEARRQSDERAQDLMALQRVFGIVAQYLRMDEAIPAILDELSATFGHGLLSIYLLDKGRLTMQAQRGYTTYYESMEIGQGVIGRAFARDQTIFVRDISVSDLYLEAVDGVVSEIAIPLHDEGRVVGVINIESSTVLDERDRDLLELFAAQVSVVLRNARLADELRDQADRDPLTGLLNHRALFTLLEQVLQRDRGCSVLVVDVDGFKQINDRFGHLAGDEALRYVAALLREHCREDDHLSRYGGDEFVVVLPEATEAGAATIAHRIAQAVQTMPCVYREQVRIPVSLSLGLAEARDGRRSPQALLDAADREMYQAKQMRAAG